MELNYETDNNFQGVDLNNFKDDAIKGFFNKNCLNDVFFSDDNINALQIGMRNMVLNTTNGESNIGRQSDIELKIIMKATYLEYGKNLEDNILNQVKNLNKKVLDFSVSRILIEIEQHKNYIIDASNIHIPMEHSSNVSNKGSKTLYRESLF
jgi:hypothetical protein|tara:strand:+ start:247 stop:702 length:456 start_codon:yes stop_codon:yes gene_type:complete